MFRRLVVAMLVAASVLGVAPVSSGHHYVAIQPGVERPGIRFGVGPPDGTVDHGAACTYNFIFRDQKKRRYIGIAGHCTGAMNPEVGQEMHVTDVGRIGTVVWKAPLPKDREAFPGSCGDLRPEGAGYCIDFALVEIDRALYGHIDPAVRHWGGPTGFVPSEEIEAGMTMYHYGYGTGPHMHEMTRPRVGVVLGTVTGGCGYRAAFPFSGSDSGSPQIAGDGRALGFMTMAEGEGAMGMSVDCVLDAAAKAGYRLELETAPLTDAVQREQNRIARVFGHSKPPNPAPASLR